MSLGGNAVHDSIWARISGDALTRNHALPSSDDTATHSCVRASTRTDPSRAPRQFVQAQFHCGQPPPADEPSTWIRTVVVLPGPRDGAPSTSGSFDRAPPPAASPLPAPFFFFNK